MAYNKTFWKDEPSTETPISAENLNKIEQGIYNAHESIDKLPDWIYSGDKPSFDGYTKEETDALLDKKANAIINNASGEVVVTTDSANATPLGIELFGKSEQVTYQGNQLLDIENPTIVYESQCNKVSENSFQVTTIATNQEGTYSYTGCNYDISEFEGMEYLTFTLGGLKVIGNAKPNLLIRAVDVNGENKVYKNMTEAGSVKIPLANIQTIMLRFYANAGNACAKGEGVIYTDVMLNKGDALPYEPYTGKAQSPSLAYQQDVVPKGASGSIEQKFLTSNLFNYDILPYDTTQTIFNGGTVTVENGKLIIDGTNATGNVTAKSKNLNANAKQIVLPKGSYFFGISTNGYYLDDNGNPIIKTVQMHGGAVKSVEKPYVITQWFLGAKAGQKFEGSFKITPIQELPYEPYSEQVLVHQTPNGLHGIGNVTDVVDSGKGQRINLFSQKVFNGSENWLLGSGQGTHKRFYLSNAFDDIDTSVLGDDNVPNALCTAFRPATPNETYTGGVNTFSINVRKVLYVCCSCTTVEEFKQKLSENPMTVYYQLEEPIVTDLTEEELAQYNEVHMNYPNTTIVNSDSAYTEVEYVADTKCYIDKKFKELEVALANTNAQLL